MSNSFAMQAVFVFLLLVSAAQAQQLKSNIPYADPPQDRQVLDDYAPDGAKNLPVVFWIHGGGWQAGDKTDVQIKPRVFAERGFVFVSTNYRLLPKVQMDVLIRDVAKALGWVHKHIAEGVGFRACGEKDLYRVPFKRGKSPPHQNGGGQCREPPQEPRGA